MSYECGRAVQHSQHSGSMFCPRLLQSTWDGERCVVWAQTRDGGNLNDSSEASSQNNEKLLSDQRGIF